MKWFKHDCDMHTDLKVQELIDREGADGYAVWCLCLEIMGQQGKKNKIQGQLRWKKAIQKVFQWSDTKRLDNILSTMVEVRLINPKSFNYGNLHIPRFNEKADDWTRRQLRSEFGETSEQLPHRTDKIRIDKIIEEYISIKGFPTTDKELVSLIYQRFGKAAKKLILIAKEKDLEALRWIAGLLNDKGLDWKLDTIVAWLPKFFKFQETIQFKEKQGQEVQAKIEQMKKEAKEHPIDPKELKKLIKGIG